MPVGENVSLNNQQKEEKMTVQDLIDELLLIEDKTKEVKTFDQDYGEWLPCGGAEDYGNFVGIR